MKTKLNGFLTLFLALVVQVSFAQEKTVSGTVTDESGGLPGVSIIIKGTTKGTDTDFDGKYSIKAKAGDVLIFSYIGYKTVERTVGNFSVINVRMEEGGTVLDEVVVVGYGTSTKKSFTGSAKTIKTEVLEAKAISNVSQALAGEVAGVTVTSVSGQPGTTSRIRVRGFGSINGNRDPLYVVDGVPFFDSINIINPADIESTTVLKDAASTAIYGSRGANGVILITTKSGNKNRSSIEVDFKTGVNFQHLPRYSVISSPEEFASLSWNALRNNGDLLNNPDPSAYASTNLFSGLGISEDYNIWNIEGTNLIDPSTGQVRSDVSRKYTPEDWFEEGTQPAIRKEVNTRFIGGNDETKYFSSFGYLDDVGYSVNSSYRRYSTRLNLEHKPSDWLTAKANINYSFGRTIANGQTNDLGNVFTYAFNAAPVYPVFLRDSDGNKIVNEQYGGFLYDYGRNRAYAGGENAVANAHFNLDRTKRHSLNGNFEFEFNLFEDLSFLTRYGASYYSLVNDDIRNPFFGSFAASGGALFKENRTLINQNFLQMFKYKKSFGTHNFEALIAHESNDYKRQRNSLSVLKAVNLVNGLDDPSNYVNSNSKPTGYTEEEKLESYFGQINYNYDGKYLASASIRHDGSSRFLNNRWGTFGSLGLGWVISRENFFSNINTINFLKLKASYGLIGDQAGADLYSGRNGYDIDVDAGGNISLPLRNSVNEELTWETSKMFQTGLEFTLFNNRIDGSFEFYDKRTTDQFFDRRLPISTGNALITVNDGILLNQGYEFDITGKIIDNDDFKLSLSVNGEMLHNELLQMPRESTGERKVLDQAGSFGRSVGRSIFDYYMREWAGVDPVDGIGMWYQNYDDLNNNGQLDSGEEIDNLTQYLASNPNASIRETTTKSYVAATERYINKSIIPKIRGGFRFNVQVKNFNISALFGYSLGGYAYDNVYAGLMHNDQVGKNNWHTDIRNSWTPDNTNTNVPRLFSEYVNSTTGILSSNFNSTSSRFLTSTDYIALNNLRVGYSIPKKLIEATGVSSVNLWLSGDNLFLFSKRDGFNPIISETGSSSTYQYSPLTNISLGVNVKF